jgi:hypothetical protein
VQEDGTPPALGTLRLWDFIQGGRHSAAARPQVPNPIRPINDIVLRMFTDACDYFLVHIRSLLGYSSVPAKAQGPPNS